MVYSCRLIFLLFFSVLIGFCLFQLDYSVKSYAFFNTPYFDSFIQPRTYCCYAYYFSFFSSCLFSTAAAAVVVFFIRYVLLLFHVVFREYPQNKCRSCTIKIDMNVLYFVHWAMCKEFTEQKSAVSVEREVNKVKKKNHLERAREVSKSIKCTQ